MPVKMNQPSRNSEAAAPAAPEVAEVNNIDQCIAHLINKIESGEIRHDMRLGEPSLAREIGVDRASVRVAFEKLSAAGILDRIPSSGTYLKKMTIEENRSAAQVRNQLEMLAARLAAQHATDSEIEGLVRAAEDLDELSDAYFVGRHTNWLEVRKKEIEFHSMIAKISHNFVLQLMMKSDTFLQMCFPFLIRISQIDAAKLENCYKDGVKHTSIAAVIKARDAKGAEILINKHIEDAFTALIPTLQAGDSLVRVGGIE